MATRSALINVMHKAATVASRNMLRDFGEVENLQVSRKGPADFVSRRYQCRTDHQGELQKARPDWGFEMEESGITAGATLMRPPGLLTHWMAPPIFCTVFLILPFQLPFVTGARLPQHSCLIRFAMNISSLKRDQVPMRRVLMPMTAG